MNFVLGVDGGNTKTLALVARQDGTIVGTGRAGCSDIYGAESPDVAIAELERAVHAALAEAGIQPEEIGAGAFSLAGADWPEDFALLEEAMRARSFGRRTLVVNDAMGALRAGSPDGTGVVVVCGTGAAIGARHPDGRSWHSSFWQEPQGAGELSLKALRAVYRTELGIDPPTLLTEKVLAILGAATVEEVLHQLTARNQTPLENWRQITRPLLDAAEAGDAAARQIVISHGESLGDYALVAARKVGLGETPFTLVLAGGVLRHPSPLMREALIGRVCETVPGVIALQSRLEPVAGAVLLALELAYVSPDHPLLERLANTLPGTAFFATG